MQLNLKKDDIITFKESEDKFITHRIIEVIKNQDEQTMYVTKGDNNEDTRYKSSSIPKCCCKIFWIYNSFCRIFYGLC